MSVTMTTTTMPALGVQLASMVGYADVCNRRDALASDLAPAWGQAHDNVFVPFGIKAKVPHEYRMSALAGLVEIIPQVREKFDARIGQLLRNPERRGLLAGRGIIDQAIDPGTLRSAWNHGLVSDGPAVDLIQSAMHAIGHERKLLVDWFGMFFLTLGAFAFPAIAESDIVVDLDFTRFSPGLLAAGGGFLVSMLIKGLLHRFKFPIDQIINGSAIFTLSLLGLAVKSSGWTSNPELASHGLIGLAGGLALSSISSLLIGGSTKRETSKMIWDGKMLG